MLRVLTADLNKKGLFLTICSSVAALFTFVFWIYISINSGPIQILYIERDSPSPFTTHKHFVSIALDSIVIAENFHKFNMNDSKLIQMVKYLAPAYIRFGGNLADKLRFSPDDIDNNSEVTEFYLKYSLQEVNYLLAPNFTMTGSQWLNLLNFTQVTCLVPIFDLNALIRFENGTWDYRNAYSLINFSHKHNIFINWELGNEPNSFKHKFNEAVNASQLGEDFIFLRQMLNQFPLYQNSLLLGPDVTRPISNHKESQLYLRDFLKKGGNAISAVTWHQYYLNGRSACQKDFLNPSTFELLEDQISRTTEIVNASHVPKLPIWLGETSSAYGGGAPHLSNTFIGSFLWIDKLGLAAKMGISVVIRQSIFKGYYSLLDENYDPNPDWWVTILYKSLVDKNTVPFHTASTSKLRLYVHCTKKSFLNGLLPSITVFGINLDSYFGKLRIEGIVPVHSNALLMAYTYELTYDKKITSKGIRLNGELLKMLPNSELPVFVPKLQTINSFVTIPPLSVVFWVIPTSNVKACL